MHLESQLRRAFHLSAPEIPEEGWASFAERAVVQVYEKNQILKKEGAPERFLHFILEGSAGVFLETAHQDICIDLCFEGEFLVDYLSLLTPPGGNPFQRPPDGVIYYPSWRKDPGHRSRKPVYSQTAATSRTAFPHGGAAV